jgi:hypothetical protein
VEHGVRFAVNHEKHTFFAEVVLVNILAAIMTETTTPYRFEIGDRVVTTLTFSSLAATIVGHAPKDEYSGSLVYWVRFDGHVGVNSDGSTKFSKLLESVTRPLPKKPTISPLDSIENGWT